MDQKIIHAPLTEPFVVVSNKSENPFIFCDSQLLEAIEHLMEDPKKNLSLFIKVQQAVNKSVEAGDAPVEIHHFITALNHMLLELREFDIRASDLLLQLVKEQ